MRARSLWLSLFAAVSLLNSVVSFAGAEGGGTHVVSPGDVLGAIAKRHGTTVGELVRLNGLRDADHIQIGQRLILPGSAAAEQPVAAPERQAPAAVGGAEAGEPAASHVVAPGETLEDIARAYGLSVDELTAVNQLSDPDFLRVGQTLTLPGAAGNARGGALEDLDYRYLRVSYRSQFDGTTYEDGNCGPAALGMVMSYYNEWWSSDGIRRDVNKQTGDWSDDGGSTWESLVFAARNRDFDVEGLYDGKRYHRWSFDELMAEVRKGRPPLLLVRFRNLPGHEYSTWWGDHYIVFLGLTANGQVLYHDSAFREPGAGANRTMSKERLMRAWGNNAAGIQYSAMVVRWHGHGE